MVDERLMARVRALLAQAEHENTSREEAEAFTEKAAELMARYGIDAAVLAESTRKPETVTSVRVDLDHPYAPEKAHLLGTVAYYSRCRAVSHKRGRTVSHLTLFGFPADLAQVELLYTSLLLQATTGLLRARMPYRSHIVSYRRTWLMGFAGGIGRRLRDAQRRAEDDATRRHANSARSVAVVLADRSALVDTAMNEAFPNLVDAKPRQLSGFGQYDGYAAAQQADLAGARVGTTIRPAIAPD
jgi:hypothetical protein